MRICLEHNAWHRSQGALMVKKPKRAALYLRVSTDGQTTENQSRALKAVAAQRSWTVVATYDDNGVCGAKGRDQRPGLDAMLTDATRGRFNLVMVWAMDRLGRSLGRSDRHAALARGGQR